MLKWMAGLLVVGTLAVQGCSSPAPTPPPTLAGSPPAVASPAAPSPAAATNFPGTEAGARQLLAEFLKSDGDRVALTAALKPTSADYARVFKDDFAKRAESAYNEKLWSQPISIGPKDESQTELLLSSASSADLKAWNEKAREFPGGWERVAPHLKDGLTMYRFKFVKPKESTGMSFDGLTHVNDRWVIFPKPWNTMK